MKERLEALGQKITIEDLLKDPSAPNPTHPSPTISNTSETWNSNISDEELKSLLDFYELIKISNIKLYKNIMKWAKDFVTKIEQKLERNKERRKKKKEFIKQKKAVGEFVPEDEYKAKRITAALENDKNENEKAKNGNEAKKKLVEKLKKAKAKKMEESKNLKKKNKEEEQEVAQLKQKAVGETLEEEDNKKEEIHPSWKAKKQLRQKEMIKITKLKPNAVKKID